MRGLRIELRRSTALWAGLVVLLSGTGMLLLVTSSSSRWTGNSTSALLHLRLPLAYTWALVVGLAAFQGMRDSRAGVTELFASASRPHWVRLGTLAAAVAGVVAVATVLLGGVAIAMVVADGGFVSFGFIPLMLVATTALASSTLLGLAVGRLLPHPLTAPVALVATFMVATTGGQAIDFQTPEAGFSPVALLTPVLNPPHSDLLTTSTSVDLGQLVWFAGVGVAAFVLLVARSAAGRLAALVPAGLAAALAISVLPAKLGDVVVTDSIGGQLVCDGPVCLSKVHEDRLPKVTEAGKAALAALSVLPGAPEQVHEDTSPSIFLSTRVRSDKIVYLNPHDFPRVLDMSVDQIRLELLAGAGVPSCSRANAIDFREGVVRYLTAAHFNGGLTELASDQWTWGNARLRADLDDAWRTFSAFPERVRLERIAQARQMMLTCADFESIFTTLVAR